MTDATTTPTSPPSTGRNLPMAIVIAVVLAAGFITSLYLGQGAVTIFIGLFMVLGALETSAQLRSRGISPLVLVLIAGTLVTAGATWRVGYLGQVLGMLVIMLGSGLWMLADPDRDNALVRLGVTSLLGLWMPFLGSFAILIAGLEDGRFALLLVIACTAMADIGAYAVGSQLGRHKIAPRLSPNKSWEGLVGGLVVAALVGWGLATWLFPEFDDGRAVLVGLACAVAGFGGDLFESMVKRDLGIKDFGSLLPGHGGVLDRVDAILAALPVGYLVLVMT